MGGRVRWGGVRWREGSCGRRATGLYKSATPVHLSSSVGTTFSSHPPPSLVYTTRPMCTPHPAASLEYTSAPRPPLRPTWASAVSIPPVGRSSSHAAAWASAVSLPPVGRSSSHAATWASAVSLPPVGPPLDRCPIPSHAATGRSTSLPPGISRRLASPVHLRHCTHVPPFPRWHPLGASLNGWLNRHID